MSADWRRTPPAPRTMFWATSPPPSIDSTKLSMTSGSARKTVVAPDASRESVGREAIMQKRSWECTGVSVTVGKTRGVNGLLSINENEVRWSGQKADSSTARSILGEVKDVGNREDRPNWTVLCSLAMIKEISTLAENEQALRLTVEESSSYEFTFRSADEAIKAHMRLMTAVHPNEGQNEKFIFSSSAFDYERRRSRENTSRRPRRSISFEPTLLEGDEDNEENDGGIAVDENTIPQYTAQLHIGKSLPQTRANCQESKSSPRTLVDGSIQNLLQPFSTVANREREYDEVDRLRKWARIYSSKNSSTEEIAAAANSISKAFNYPLNEHPNKSIWSVRRSPEEQRALEREHVQKIIPAIKNMKEASDLQRARVERETEVTIQSPTGKERRFFRYICKVTGNPVSPGTFEKRYQERILGWPSMPQVVEEPAMTMDSLEMTDGAQESGLIMEPPKDSDSEEETHIEERMVEPLEHVLQSTASVVDAMDIVEFPGIQLVNNAQPDDHPQGLNGPTMSPEEQFAEALRIEEDELHLAFDRALERYRTRRQELEKMYGI